jgi:hypothetical protein
VSAFLSTFLSKADLYLTNVLNGKASISQFDSIAIAAPYSWERKVFLSHFQVPITDNTVGNSIDELGMQETF